MNDAMRGWWRKGGNQRWLKLYNRGCLLPFFPLLSLFKSGSRACGSGQQSSGLSGFPHGRSTSPLPALPVLPSKTTLITWSYIIAAVYGCLNDCSHWTPFFTRFLVILVVAFLWWYGGPDPFENLRLNFRGFINPDLTNISCVTCTQNNSESLPLCYDKQGFQVNGNACIQNVQLKA